MHDQQRDLLAAMAADLRANNATGSEAAAMRLLLAKPYRWGDVVALADKALTLARQPLPASGATPSGSGARP